jgi:hypothetical protein
MPFYRVVMVVEASGLVGSDRIAAQVTECLQELEGREIRRLVAPVHAVYIGETASEASASQERS